MSTKYAFVTGADHGLGYALVEKLMERNYYVVAARLNPEENQIDKLCEVHSSQMKVLTLDVGCDESVSVMKKQIATLIPHLDLLINNAGILGDMNKVLGDDLDFDEVLRVFNVNALGPLRVTNALMELILQSNDKTVINISSEAGSLAKSHRKGWFGYCMSKSANNMQSTIVHNNLLEHGGRVIAMHPGHVATYMRGHLDTTAAITAEESATGILHTVLDQPLPTEKLPVYIDYQGKRWPW